jgi:hypothetical protein
MTLMPCNVLRLATSLTIGASVWTPTLAGAFANSAAALPRRAASRRYDTNARPIRAALARAESAMAQAACLEHKACRNRQRWAKRTKKQHPGKFSIRRGCRLAARHAAK